MDKSRQHEATSIGRLTSAALLNCVKNTQNTEMKKARILMLYDMGMLGVAGVSALFAENELMFKEV